MGGSEIDADSLNRWLTLAVNVNCIALDDEIPVINVERKDLKLRYVGIGWLALKFFIGNPGFASEPEASDINTGYMSFIPFIREHPCIYSRYRQLVASLPLQATSDGDEGHPWRAMYGLCVAQKGRLSLHQGCSQKV